MLANHLPKDWNLQKLNDCLEEIIDYRGKSTPKDSYGYQLITARNVRFGYIDFEPKEYMNPDDYAKWMTRGFPKPNDILFTTEAPLGNVALYPNVGTYALAQRLVTLRTNKKLLNSKYLLYYLLSNYGQRQVNLKATGTTAIGIRQSELRKISVILPPLPEQQKIAEILSIWDEAITKTERLIAVLRERKKGLMQRLLTGQVRFAGFEESNAKQDTKYGEIPVDWNYVTIESIADQLSVKNNKGSDLPVLSCTKYDGLVNSLIYFGRQVFSEDTSTYKIVKYGQFAYATNHIEEGSIGYQNLYDRALISPMYTVFKTKGNIDDSFLYKLLKTELYRHIFEVNTSASVDRRGSLRWNVFSQIRIPLPSLKEQEAIAGVIDLCEQEIIVTQRRLAALRQQKKGLMQRLLTGQVRVKIK